MSPSIKDSTAPLLTPDDVAARLQVSRRTVYQLVRSGLKPTFIGRLLRVREADLAAYVEAQAAASAPAAQRSGPSLISRDWGSAPKK